MISADEETSVFYDQVAARAEMKSCEENKRRPTNKTKYTVSRSTFQQERMAAAHRREEENIVAGNSDNSEKKSAGTKRKLGDGQDSIRKPKRPMSSYNYFFKECRSLIASALSRANTNDEVQEVLASFGENNIQLGEAPEGSSGTSLEKKKKFNGGVTFEDIGKIIGRRWRSLDQDSLERYRILADADTVRYHEEKWKYTEENDRRLSIEILRQKTSGEDLERAESAVPNEYSVLPPDRNMSFAGSRRMIDSAAVDQVIARSFLEKFNQSMLTGGQDQRNIPSLTSMDARSREINSDPAYLSFVAPNQTRNLSSMESRRMIDSSAVDQVIARSFFDSFNQPMVTDEQVQRNIPLLTSMDAGLREINSEQAYSSFVAPNQTQNMSSVESRRMIDSSAVDEVIARSFLGNFNQSILTGRQDQRIIPSLNFMNASSREINSEPAYLSFAMPNQTPMPNAGCVLSYLNSNSSSNSSPHYLMHAFEGSAQLIPWRRESCVNELHHLSLQTPRPQVAMRLNSSFNPRQGIARSRIPQQQVLFRALGGYVNVSYPDAHAAHFSNEMLSHSHALPSQALHGVPVASQLSIRHG